MFLVINTRGDGDSNSFNEHGYFNKKKNAIDYVESTFDIIDEPFNNIHNYMDETEYLKPAFLRTKKEVYKKMYGGNTEEEYPTGLVYIINIKENPAEKNPRINKLKRRKNRKEQNEFTKIASKKKIPQDVEKLIKSYISFGKKRKKVVKKTLTKALKNQAKIYKIRLTLKRGNKRVYKSENVLKKQIKNKMKI